MGPVVARTLDALFKSWIHLACGALVGLVPAHAAADEPVRATSEYEEPDHVLLPADVDPGGYGTPKVKVTKATGVAAILFGGPGRWFMDHGFAIRAAGYGLVTAAHEPPAMASPMARAPFQFGFGGPQLAYLFRPHDVLHFNLGFIVGVGGYTIVSQSYTDRYQGARDGHHFFALEPQAELEANMMRYTRVAFALTYRYIGMSYVPGIEPSDLGGTAASVLVKLGAF